MTDDLELLRKYAENGSEEAFATVVSRHIRLVYGAAMRHLGNTHEAEEITQAVFIILARKAGKLPRGTVLSGWLFQTTRLTACNHLRTEARRKTREQEAHMQSKLEQNENDDVWQQVAPLLDSAIASLGSKDRDAVVLRYVEGRELAEVGQMLDASESAAQKRVNRAVERLRKFFTKRGVVVTAALLASAISANAAPAAPAALTASVLKGATAGASTLALINGTLKVMAWAKLKFAATIGAGMALATGGIILAVHYTAEASHDRNEVATLSHESPFVRQLLNPPWIKVMRLAYGRYVYGLNGPTISNGIAQVGSPTWNVVTQTVALQPSGMYVETFNAFRGGVYHHVSGVDEQIYWEGDSLRKSVLSTPVAPEATFQTPGVAASRPRIEEVRHLGLPALKPGTFAMQDDGNRFTAETLKGQPLEGKILKVSNDRPLELTYHIVRPLGFVEVTVTYQYASPTAPLPSSIGHTETSQVRQRSTSGGNGMDLIVSYDYDRDNTTTTNWILSADYGLDESVTKGYSPSKFFKDVDQYAMHVNLWSNGTAYFDGVAQTNQGPLGLRGGRGIAVQLPK